MQPGIARQRHQRAARYVLREPINSGSHGTVYRAVDIATGQQRAVKVLPRVRHDVRDARRVRFDVCSEATNMLRARGHKNVVYLHDVVSDAANHYLVEEYCGGAAVPVRAGQPWQCVRDARRVLRDAAAGLEHVHSRGMLFLDVKPQNIVQSATTGDYKLTDFGSSRRLRPDEQLHVSEVTCTPLFASPEVVAQEGAVTGAHDVWALGVLGFWLLAGRHPFVQDGHSAPDQLMRAIVHAPAPREGVPAGALRELIAGMLEKDARSRPSIGAVLRALEQDCL